MELNMSPYNRMNNSTNYLETNHKLPRPPTGNRNDTGYKEPTKNVNSDVFSSVKTNFSVHIL